VKVFNLLVLIIIAVIAVSCSKEEEGKYIADVDGNFITENEFKNRYTEYLKMTELKDNIKLRYDVLRMMIDDKILLKYADTSGFIQKPEIQNLLNFQQDQIYLNYYFENYIYPELKVTDAEMREAFRRSKIKMHARHLYASDSIKAKQIKKKLDAGESFELLAKTNFKDPILASNGGDIGWFSYGEIDPAFENTAYKLSAGEISDPVKTRNGYSIIQILGKKQDPFITEHEYRTNEKWLRLKLKEQKHSEFVEDKTDQILADLEIKFNKSMIEELFEQLPHIKREFAEGNFIPEVLIKSPSKIVLKSKNGDWDIQHALFKLSELQKPQWELIKTSDDLFSALKGLAIREEIEKRINDKNIGDQPEVKNKVKEYIDMRILRELVQTIKDSAKVKNDQLLAYYNEHSNEICTPEIYQVAEIVVLDSILAREIFEKIKTGTDFATLAREYSIEKRSAANGGYLGWGGKDQFGKLADTITKADCGQIIGPISYYHKYIIINKMDEKPSRQLTYEESRSIIEEKLLPETAENAYKNIIRELRKGAEISINDKNVKRLNVNIQRGIS